MKRWQMILETKTFLQVHHLSFYLIGEKIFMKMSYYP